MTEIQQNRWDRLVRRAANIVGGGSQVSDTLNELFPTIDVENVPLELLALTGTNICWATSRLVPSLLDFNHHQLFNPASSENLIVVENILIKSSAVQRMRMEVNNTPLTTDVGNVQRRDTRFGITTTNVGQSRSDQLITTIVSFYETQLEVNIISEISDPKGIAVLFPGTGLEISATVLNNETFVAWRWRERVAEPAELNL